MGSAYLGARTARFRLTLNPPILHIAAAAAADAADADAAHAATVMLQGAARTARA